MLVPGIGIKKIQLDTIIWTSVYNSVPFCASLVDSLTVHLYFYLTQQHLKGLSAFMMRGHLTDSTARKIAPRAKGQGLLPTKKHMGAALL